MDVKLLGEGVDDFNGLFVFDVVGCVRASCERQAACLSTKSSLGCSAVHGPSCHGASRRPCLPGRPIRHLPTLCIIAHLAQASHLLRQAAGIASIHFGGHCWCAGILTTRAAPAARPVPGSLCYSSGDWSRCLKPGVRGALASFSSDCPVSSAGPAEISRFFSAGAHVHKQDKQNNKISNKTNTEFGCFLSGHIIGVPCGACVLRSCWSPHPCR